MSDALKKNALEFINQEKVILVGIAIYFGIAVIFPFLVYPFNVGLGIVFNGAVLGTLYAVLALGFSLIYGVAKQLKLSIGGYYVIAGYTMFFLLETIQIIPAIPANVDGIFLILLVVLPVVVTGLLVVRFFQLFTRLNFLIVGLSPIIAAGGALILGVGVTSSFYLALAVGVLGLTGWYLGLPERKVVGSTLGIGILCPILIVLGLPVVFVSLMVLAIIFTGMIAMISDRYLLDRFRHSPVNVMIVTFALALIYQSIVQLVVFPEDGHDLKSFGSGKRSLQGIVPSTANFVLFDETIETIRFISVMLSILIVLSLYIFIWFSKTGVALRAVSQDEEAAALAGVDIRKTTALVSGVGMGLIGFAAVLTAPFAARPWFAPFMGWTVLIFAISVVTLGGMGSLIGSVIAAFVISYAEVIVSSIDPSLALSIPFLVVLLVMIVKPEGLFGEVKELE